MTTDVDSMQYLLSHKGTEIGQFTEAELIHAIAAGRIFQSSLVWWEGQADWVPVTEKFSHPFAMRAKPSLKDDRLYYFFQVAFWMFQGKPLVKQIGVWVMAISAACLFWSALSFYNGWIQMESLGHEVNVWAKSDGAQESALLWWFGDSTLNDQNARFGNQADRLGAQLHQSMQAAIFWAIILTIATSAQYVSGIFKINAHWKRLSELAP